MDEKELIRKSLSGDEMAFEILMAENKEAVYRHCLGIIKDEELAKDLTQETFVHAFQHLDSFRLQAKFSTWLWRIAHNLSLNFLKKKHLEKEYKEEITPHKFLEKEAFDGEMFLKIQALAEKLPDKQRLVFEMYDLQHMPQKEIAAILGISHGTVRSRLFYARKKIRELLSKA